MTKGVGADLRGGSAEQEAPADGAAPKGDSSDDEEVVDAEVVDDGDDK